MSSVVFSDRSTSRLAGAVVLTILLFVGYVGAAPVVSSRFVGAPGATVTQGLALVAPGEYGPDFVPNPRRNMVSWPDPLDPDVVWVYSGYVGVWDCRANGVVCILGNVIFPDDEAPNDLWKFNVRMNQWAYLNGTSPFRDSRLNLGIDCNHFLSGPVGNSNAGAWPTYRYFSHTWTSLQFPGLIYMFGGAMHRELFNANDMWAFNTTSAHFTFWGGGANVALNPPQAGGTNAVPGVYSTSNYPAARSAAAYWTANDGSYWLHGGLMRSDDGDRDDGPDLPPFDKDDFWGDMWSFRPPASPTGNPFQWKMMWTANNDFANAGVSRYSSDCDQTSAVPLYVEGGNYPRSMALHHAVVDSIHRETVWLFGGKTKVFNNWSGMNRLWRFNMTSLLFALYDPGTATSFGTAGIYSPATRITTPTYEMPAWLVLPQNPNIAYTFGGGTRTASTSGVWAMILGNHDAPPKFIYCSSTSFINIDDSVNGPFNGTGFFDVDHVPPSVLGSVIVRGAVPYTFNLLMGEQWTAVWYARSIQISVLHGTWVVNPPPLTLTGDVMLTQPCLYVAAVPYEFTTPVNGVTATLLATTDGGLTVVPASRLQGTLTINVVNGWANWTDVRIVQAGVYQFLVSLGGGAPHAVLSTPILSACTVGCQDGQCTGGGLLFPSPCQYCDTAAGYAVSVDGTVCVSPCPAATYTGIVSGRSRCVVCSPGCLNCTTSGLNFPSACTRCDETKGYILNNGFCVPGCVVGSFANLTATPPQCQPCTVGCANCTSTGLTTASCSACDHQKAWRVNVAGTLCVSTCEAGEFWNEGNDFKCRDCSVGCAECTGTGLARPSCTKCDKQQGYALLGLACVSDCGAARYVDTSAAEAICSKCNAACTTCTDPGVLLPGCATCDQPAYVISEDGTQCVAKCQPGFYKNATIEPNRCMPCTPGCASCSGTGLGITCNQCNDTLGFTRDGTNCISGCRDGFYPAANGGELACRACKATCITCTSETYCTSCNGAMGVGLLPGGVCDSCPPGQNTTDGICRPIVCDPPDATLWDSACGLTPWHERCTMTCKAGYESAFEYNAPGYLCERIGSNGAGYYVDPPACTLCHANSYNPTAGGRCVDCLLSVTAGIGATSVDDCLCLPYYYLQSSGVCVKCPTGAYCPGGNQAPVSAPGYFQPSQGVFVPCLPYEGCLGDNKCAPGYEGNLCGRCSYGYYRLTGTCVPCGDNTEIKIIIGAVLGTLACVVLIVLARPNPIGRPNFTVSTPSIALACIQVTATFGTINLPWPAATRSMFSISSALNFNIEIVNAECVTQFNYYDKLQVTLLIPLVVFVVFCVIFAVLCVVLYVRHKFKEAAKHQLRAVATLFSAGFVLFLNLAYLFLAQATLGFFACISHEDGTVTLKESPAQACYDDIWFHYLPLAVFGVAAYIFIIPIFIISVYAYLSRKHGKMLALNHGAINFIVVKYRVSVWFWEFVVLARKLLIVGISSFVVDNPIVSAVLCSAVLFASCVATVSVKPFHWDKHDVAEVTSIVTSLLVLFAGIVSGTPDISSFVQYLAGWLAVGVVCLAALIFLANFILELYITYVVVVRMSGASNHRGTLEKHNATITSMDARGQVLWSGDAVGVLRRWDTSTLTEDVTRNLGVPIEVLSVIDAHGLAVGLSDGSLLICDPESLAQIVRLPSSSGAVRCLASIHGCLLTGHADGSVQFWRAEQSSDLTTLAAVACHKIAEGDVRALMRDTEGDALYICSSTGVVTQWEVSVNLDVMIASQWNLSRGRLEDIACHQGVLYVAAGSNVQAVDIKSCTPLCDFPSDAAGVSRVMVAGGRLFTGTWSGVANVWELQGAFVQGTPGKQAHITALAAHEDTFFSADAAGAIHVFAIRSGDVTLDLDPLRRRWHRYRAKHGSAYRPLLFSNFMVGDGASSLHDAHEGSANESDILMNTSGTIGAASVSNVQLATFLRLDPSLTRDGDSLVSSPATSSRGLSPLVPRKDPAAGVELTQFN